MVNPLGRQVLKPNFLDFIIICLYAILKEEIQLTEEGKVLL